jgi:Fe-S-cluster containining protein
MKQSTKSFPEGMTPLGKSAFTFRCHPGVSCFTQCCRKLELFLYPFDIIRLKKALAISSEDFLHSYAGVVSGSNPLFPSVILRMRDNEACTCPFLGEGEAGCTVYHDRPSACRTYPLERAVDRASRSGRPDEYYFMTSHEYCHGHHETQSQTVTDWLRDQRLLDYNMMDDLWAEMDTIFAENPWQGEGGAGPRQQIAFMVCYNIDGFRRLVREQDLLGQFKLSRSEIAACESDDEALLKFGFKWLQMMLVNRPTLKPRRR